MEQSPISFLAPKFLVKTLVVFAISISGLFLFSSSAHANTLYAKAAGGNWTAAGTWSSTGSGGADSSGPPTSATDVIFESGSGNVTINAAASARSVNMTSGTGSYTGTLTHNAFDLNIGDSTAGAGNVALKFSSGMTYTVVSPNGSELVFVSSSATQQTITTAGKTTGNVLFNNASGSWQMGDNLTTSGIWRMISAGAFDLNSKTITTTQVSTTFQGGGKTYNGTVVIAPITGNGTGTLSDTNTFTNLTITGPSVSALVYTLNISNNQTITGTLTINGNSATNRVLIAATTVGTPITLTANNPVVTNAGFMDITASGTGWDLSAITGLSGDAGGNSGITFTPAATQYWHTTTTGTKTWSTAGNWFLATNGGGGSGRVPLPQDDVVFDANSIGATSTTIQSDMPRLGKNINFTGVTNSPTWSNTATNTIYGSLTLVSGMTVSGTNVTTFGGRSSYTITSAGKTFTQGLTFTAPGGTYSLADALITNGQLLLNNGTFDAQNTSVNANVTMQTFSSSNSNTRTLTMGTGTWSITGNNTTIWLVTTSTNFTLNRGNAIQLTYSGSTGTRTISQGGGSGIETNSADFAVTAGSDSIAFAGGSVVRNMDFTGFSGTWTNAQITMYGNLTVVSGMTVGSGTNAITFGATSGTKTITSAGKTLDFPLTFSGVGGTFQLADNLTVGSTRTVTLTNGTLDANGHNFSMGIFSSTNSNTRTITMGTGTWSITGNATTVWTTSTSTGLTLNRGNPIQFTYSGSTGSRTIVTSTVGTEAQSFDMSITAGSDGITIGNTDQFHDLNFTGYSGALAIGSFTVFGNLTLSSTMTMGGVSTITFAATSGTKTFTTSGQTLDYNLTFNGVGGTWQFADNVTITSVRTVTVTNGTLDANGHNLTMGLFNSTNSNTRTIIMGSGTWTVTGNNATVFTTSTSTGLTFARVSPIIFNYSGSTGTRTIVTDATGGTEALSPDISITAGSDSISYAAGARIHNLNYTGFSGTVNNFAISIYGNLTVSSGMTFASGISAVTFATTSGTQTITSAGKTFDFPITFNGVGGTFQLADNLTVGSTRTVTLTNGTLDANGHNFSMGLFNSNNSNTRTITMGLGTWSLTGNAATVWNTDVATNMTLNKGNPIQLTYSGSTGTRTVDHGNNGATAANTPDFNITAGSDIFSSGNRFCGSLDFTGFSGTLASVAFNLYGNLIISTGMTSSGPTVMTFVGTSGTQTITSNGKTLDFPITFNGSGGTFSLADDLTMGSSRTLTLTAGTFTANNHNLSVGKFFSSGPTTRTLTMGSGTWTLSGTGSVWDTGTNTNMTFNPNTSTIKITDTSSATNTFTGGSLTYNNIWWSRGSSTGSNIIGNNNTFNEFKDDGSAAHSLLFGAAGTTTVTTWNVSGSAGNLITINSDLTSFTHTLVKAGGGTIHSDYLNIQHSIATPSNTWFPGDHSINNQDVAPAGSGWVFTPTAPSAFDGASASNTSITWTWTDNSSTETGFKIYDSSNNLIATIAANTTTYTETGLVKGTSYTRYVVAYNSYGNSAASNSVTVTTDTNEPTPFGLISPSDGALVDTGLPTFSFYKATETRGTIASYILYVGDTSYTNIPASGSAASNPASGIDYKDTYTAQYLNEGDSNSINDIVSITLKGIPIPDGKYSWYVKAIDTDGGTTVSTNRTVRIDATKPVIGNIVFSGSSLHPTLSTIVTDNYSLGSATVELQKANTLFGAKFSYTTFATQTYSLGGKSQTIVFTAPHDLIAGISYRYVVTVTDAAGNQTTASTTRSTTSSQQTSAQDIASLNPNTATTEQIVTTLRGTLPPSILNIPQLEAQAVVRRQLQAAQFDKLLQRIIAYMEAHQGALEKGVIALYHSISGEVRTIASALNVYRQPIVNETNNILAFGKQIVPTNSLSWIQRVIVAINDAFSSGQHTRVAEGLINRQLIDTSLHHIIDPMKSAGNELALRARSFYEIVFDRNPTKISNLAMTNLTPTSVTVTWDTNHLTSVGKVNYGTSTSYTQEAFEPNGLRDHHVVTLTNLNPQTTYYFEVMNQGHQYVYDAYYTVTTPGNGQQPAAPRLVPQDAVVQGPLAVPVYASPDTSSAIIKTLLPGAVLRALKEETGWVSVLLSSGQEVWIHADAVKLQDHVGPSASAQH